jgi:hypothetical protein
VRLGGQKRVKGGAIGFLEVQKGFRRHNIDFRRHSRDIRAFKNE